MGWNEDTLHRWLAELPWPLGLEGSRGHDAAVLRPEAGRPVTCVDQCVEGIHFDPQVDPAAAGAKAVLRCLSDLAATAAEPRAVTLAVCAPADWSEDRLRSVITGAREAAVRHGAELVAGDLAQGPGPAALTVTAIGALPLEGRPVGRDRARPGQQVVVTGPLGGSLPSGRHLRIEPRLEAGRRLWAAGATAMMDVSDGLALDLSRLARASGVRIELDLAKVPVHDDAVRAAAEGGPSSLERALGDGEDHELVATLDSPSAIDGVLPIGRVLEGQGLVLLAPGPDGAVEVQEWTPGRSGWIHGGDGPGGKAT